VECDLLIKYRDLRGLPVSKPGRRSQHVALDPSLQCQFPVIGRFKWCWRVPLPKTRAVGSGCDLNVGWIEIAATAILGGGVRVLLLRGRDMTATEREREEMGDVPARSQST
jgi:hypothetical protein